VADRLLEFFETDATTRLWFLSRSVFVAPTADGVPDAEVEPGASAVPALAFDVAADAAGEAKLLERVVLAARGEGDDAAGLSRVRLCEDLDGDGLRDPEETVLATGQFVVDDGQVELFPTPVPVLAPGQPRRFLITYEFAAETGARVTGASPSADPGSATPAWLFASLLLIPGLLRRRRPLRRAAGLLALAVLCVASSCGGGGGRSDSPGDSPAVSPTYTASLVALDVEGQTSGDPAPVAGLPVAGATLTVAPAAP
jgi:hypothetical protein